LQLTKIIKVEVRNKYQLLVHCITSGISEAEIHCKGRLSDQTIRKYIICNQQNFSYIIIVAKSVQHAPGGGEGGDGMNG